MAKLLTKLTPEQEARIPAIRDEFLRIGLSTEPADFDAAEQAARDAYAVAGLPAPELFIRLASPMEGAIGAAILKGNRIGGSVWAQVRAQVGAQVGDQVGDQVRAQVWDQVRDQVWDQVCFGQHDSSWLSFYFAMGKIGASGPEKLSPLMRIAETCGWWWPFAGAVIVTPQPTELHRNSALRLHCDGGPALAYGDSFYLYCLNGVRVPQWLAETPSEKIDGRKIAEINNAEVRREFVNKVGMERLWHSLRPNTLDTLTAPIGGTYTLADLNVGSERPWRVLRMENPSIPEIWHVEGVDPACNTVADALNFRNGLREDQIDDTNGAEWFQQGDVIMRPTGKSTFRRFPTVLT